MERECPTPESALNQSGGTEGMWLSPLHVKATQASSRPHTFPLQAQTKNRWHEARQTGPRGTAPVIPFLNPDHVGLSSEAPLIVDGQKVTALIDSDAQVSSISSGFCDLLALEVHPLGRLLELESTGGSIILYLGYVEANLHIPGIKGYNEDVLLLVIPTTTCSEKVPVMVRSKIIDQAMGMMTEGELARETVIWKQAHFRVTPVVLHNFKGRWRSKEGGHSLPKLQSCGIQRGSAWMVFEELFIPPRRLPFLHLGLLASTATWVSGDTACWSTCLLNQHNALNCLPLWFQLLPMGNCTQGPLEYQSASET